MAMGLTMALWIDPINSEGHDGDLKIWLDVHSSGLKRTNGGGEGSHSHRVEAK